MRLTHYTPSSLLNPTHPVTVLLAGCGGNGAQILAGLARMHVALQGLGHPGFHVAALDPDTVSKANRGRQPFASADVGHAKASILVTRLNRFYDLAWEAYPLPFDQALLDGPLNNDLHWVLGNFSLIISCVDSAAARLEIAKAIEILRGHNSHALYHLDLGNTQQTGQAVLGTVHDVPQPKDKEDTAHRLPGLIDLYGDLASQDTVDQGPSCSLAQALSRQDLFINSTLANLALDIVWKLFRDLKLEIHGAFANLRRMQVNPLWIDPATWERMGWKNA